MKSSDPDSLSIESDIISKYMESKNVTQLDLQQSDWKTLYDFWSHVLTNNKINIINDQMHRDFYSSN